MLVSISAILLSGTVALLTAGVAAGLGRGVGVGLAGVVCGRVWLMTAKAIMAVRINAARISLFITSPGSCSRIFYPQITQIMPRRKNGGQDRPPLTSGYCTGRPLRPAGSVLVWFRTHEQN